MRIAGVQFAATDDPSANLELVRRSILRAAEAGARLVVFPEASMARFGGDLRAAAQTLGGPWAESVRTTARAAGVVVVVGIFTPADGGRVANTLLVTGPGVESSYRKIHLFDAFGYRESDTVAPGDELVSVQLDGVHIGLSTCYDLRFGELYRAHAESGASLLVVPASWGAGAGKELQWEILLRARAIENGCFVLGVDQSAGAAGGAPSGVGRSMLVDPRGEIRSSLGAADGLLIADVELAEVQDARRAVPSLSHRRPELFDARRC